MSFRLGSFRPKDVLRKLKAAGFVIDHQTGSHIVLIHPSNKIRTVVPYHVRDIKRGLLFAIIKQAGLTLAEFQDL